jgi:DNA invertase Pin-like site-specific DNA recombinase
MLTVLGGLAELERDLIHRGRKGARHGAGPNMGRPPKLTPHRQREAIRRRDMDGETLRSIAPSYSVSPQTISRL